MMNFLCAVCHQAWVFVLGCFLPACSAWIPFLCDIGISAQHKAKKKAEKSGDHGNWNWRSNGWSHAHPSSKGSWSQQAWSSTWGTSGNAKGGGSNMSDGKGQPTCV